MPSLHITPSGGTPHPPVPRSPTAADLQPPGAGARDLFSARAQDALPRRAGPRYRGSLGAAGRALGLAGEGDRGHGHLHAAHALDPAAAGAAGA